MNSIKSHMFALTVMAQKKCQYIEMYSKYILSEYIKIILIYLFQLAHIFGEKYNKALYFECTSTCNLIFVP